MYEYFFINFTKVFIKSHSLKAFKLSKRWLYITLSSIVYIQQWARKQEFTSYLINYINVYFYRKYWHILHPLKGREACIVTSCIARRELSYRDGWGHTTSDSSILILLPCEKEMELSRKYSAISVLDSKDTTKRPTMKNPALKYLYIFV